MYYTVRGAARYLGVSRGTIRNRILSGKFPEPDAQYRSIQESADLWHESTLDKLRAAKEAKEAAQHP